MYMTHVLNPKNSLFLTSAYGQYDDYDSSDMSNDPVQPELVEQNITYEIYIGNATFSLDDLETYDVSIEINLPDTKSLKEKLFYL